MASVELTKDIELVERALANATIYVAGHDQADAARSTSDKVAFSALRTLLEQAAKAMERIVSQLTPPEHDPCILPPTGRDGGPL